MQQRLIVLAMGVCLLGVSHPGAAAIAQGDAPTPQVSATASTDKAERLEVLYAEYWEASLKRSPLQATSVGDPRYNDQLPNTLSADYRRQTHDFETQWLGKAKAIGSDGLDVQARLSHEIFVRNLEKSLEGERFPTWQQPINQFRNIGNSFVQLGSGTNAQPFKNARDYDNWRKRASHIPALFDQAIANMHEGMKAGVVQPKVLMTKVVGQLDAVISDKPEDTLFWKPVTEFPEGMAEVDRTRLSAEYRRMIEQELMPAYRKLRDFIAGTYLPAARDSVSLSALPDGAAWYAYNVRNSTSTDLTPAQIHAIGLSEVERIHGEMKQVMEQVGFEGSLQDFFVHMNTDKRFEFATEGDLLVAYRAFEKQVERGVAPLFSLTPKAAFEIRPIEPFRAPSAASSYQRPSEDGTRPGIFYVNTYDLPTRKSWEKEALFLHEAIPGHHFQLALQQELGGLPKFRRFGGEIAFSEGWGLYAESLGKELGVYTDPYQYFGRLQGELWRAVRLVVDTGLHEKDWSREQVVAYMKANSAASNTMAVSEAERYIAIPAQALAYKIGELKIKALRARAEKALGGRFDVRAFHAEVLRDGSVPLDVLEAKLDRWITTQQARG